jgi:hypothetical protein
MSPSSDNIDGFNIDFSTGLEAGVWADVAQFVTNVTAAPAGDGNACELRVVEEYTMLLGANAGATLAIEEHTWGPTPNTQIPIWYTTLADVCAVTKSITGTTIAASGAATVIGRGDLTTTSTTTKVTYTATVCLNTTLVNCPVSLQSTSRNTVTKTLTTAVPSGSKATFPTTTQNTAVSTIAFGANINEMTATSGSPMSYIPTASSSSGSSGSIGSSSVLKGKTGGVSNKVIIGVSVGVGVPVLIAIVAGCL